MQIIETKEFYVRKEFSSHRMGLERQYGRRDVMWKGSILAILNLRLKPGRRCIELHYGTFGVNFDPVPLAT